MPVSSLYALERDAGSKGDSIMSAHSLTSPSEHELSPIAEQHRLPHISTVAQVEKDKDNGKNTGTETPKTWRFWVILSSVCLIAFVSAVDATVTAIALPKVANDLHLGDKYVAVMFSFWLAQTVFQPLCAQLSNVLGRKAPMLTSVAIFCTGGIVSGSASSTKALIIGRTIQGLGSGGIFLLMEIIVCDIVTLRERGKYVSLVFSMSAVGAVIGPPLGGIIAESNWRWIFYVNVIMSGLVFVLMAAFMHLKYTKKSSIEAIHLIDWIGSFLFIGSTASILVGLGSGGTLYSWRSARVVVPLAVGAVGLIVFQLFENSLFCKNPTVPARMFGNRTSIAGFGMTFIFATLTTWLGFAWPVYLQAVRRNSPLRAGVNYIVFEIFLIVSAGISGTLLTRLGYYRPIQFFGFSLLTLGPGLCILLTIRTSTVVWVICIAVCATGLGSVLTTILPAVLAALPESDVASATGMFSFLRSSGYMWGACFSGIVFNESFQRYSYKIKDSYFRTTLGRGHAYQNISSSVLEHAPNLTRHQVLEVYTDALRVLWMVAVAFAFCGVLLVFVEKHVPLRKKLNTEYGLDERKKATSSKVHS